MVTTLRFRQSSRIALAVLTAVLLATIAVPVAAATAQWIVPTGTPLPSGSTVIGSFPVADAMLVTGSTAPDGGVAYDTPLGLRSLDGAPAAVDANLTSGVDATGAPTVWENERGEQAVVALVDTGVAPVPALEGAVAGEIDFSGTGGGDGYGHGTFLASLIAGRGEVPGVAPEAGILSLKVSGNDGTATLGSVVSALQWLHGPGDAAGLRVATLALGVDPGTDAAKILDHATDALARKGMLVVTASGNDATLLSSPATATGTYSVGSYNDETGEVSAFTGSGVDRAGVAQPDILAPGESLVGSMPADSVIGRDNPNSWVPGHDGLFYGTGTSMATALTAGVAALASSTRPDLDGAALTAALEAGGTHVNAPAAVASALAAPQGKAVNAPPWADDPSAGPGTNGNGSTNGKAGEADPNGLRWTGLRWTGLRWTGLRWTGLRWTGLRWTGDHWGDEAWGFGRWSGLRWTGHGWQGPEADASPNGLRWTGLRWSGLRWSGLRWSGLRWSGLRWSMLEAPTT